MGIADSLDYKYWPSIAYPLALGMLGRNYNYYATNYAATFADYSIPGPGGNISSVAINALIDAQDPPVTGPSCPSGILDPAGTFCTFWGYSIVSLIGASDAGPWSFTEQLQAMILGLLIWQAYRLHLLQQAIKLDKFGRRGLPLGYDLP